MLEWLSDLVMVLVNLPSLSFETERLMSDVATGDDFKLAVGLSLSRPRCMASSKSSSFPVSG